MRSFVVAIMVILVSLTASWPSELKPADYTGEIIYTDGTTVEYTRLWASLLGREEGDKIPFSKDIMGMKRTPIQWVLFSAVSKVDFVDLTDSEKDSVASLIPRIIRKAKITFRDGAVYDNVYLDCQGWSWKSEREEGRVEDLRVKSLTVHLKDAKKCPECGREFKEAGYEFCPFDGTPLKKMEE